MGGGGGLKRPLGEVTCKSEHPPVKTDGVTTLPLDGQGQLGPTILMGVSTGCSAVNTPRRSAPVMADWLDLRVRDITPRHSALSGRSSLRPSGPKADTPLFFGA